MRLPRRRRVACDNSLVFTLGLLTHAPRPCRVWVLSMWLAVLGVANATPWIKPSSFAALCTTKGTVWSWVDGQADAMPTAAHGLECALCLPLAQAEPRTVLPMVHGLVPRVALADAFGWASATVVHAQARGPPLV